jgi:hypothetical protein
VRCDNHGRPPLPGKAAHGEQEPPSSRAGVCSGSRAMPESPPPRPAEEVGRRQGPRRDERPGYGERGKNGCSGPYPGPTPQGDHGRLGAKGAGRHPVGWVSNGDYFGRTARSLPTLSCRAGIHEAPTTTSRSGGSPLALRSEADGQRCNGGTSTYRLSTRASPPVPDHLGDLDISKALTVGNPPQQSFRQRHRRRSCEIGGSGRGPGQPPAKTGCSRLRLLTDHEGGTAVQMDVSPLQGPSALSLGAERGGFEPPDESSPSTH